MSEIEVKTADLSGAALDWAVAKAIEWKEPIFCIGRICYIEEDQYLIMEKPDPDEPDDVTKPHHFNHYEQWSPSRIWSQVGPMIDKYRVWLSERSAGNEYPADEWCADVNSPKNMACRYNYFVGRSPLIAACRAIVAAKLGDTVQVPAELVEVAQ